MPRIEAKSIVETACKRAVNEKKHLRDILAHDPRVTIHLNAERLDTLFDPATYLGASEAVIERVLALYRLTFTG